MNKDFERIEKLSQDTFDKGIALIQELKKEPLTEKEQQALASLKKTLNDFEQMLLDWLEANPEEPIKKAS